MIRSIASLLGPLLLRSAHLLPLAALVAAGVVAPACSDPDPWPPLPDSVVAPPDWEFGEDPGSYATWQQGVVMTPKSETELGPCPDVRVELWSLSPDGRRYASKLATTVSDAEGRFRVGPGPADRWVVRLFKEGFAEGCAGRGQDIPGSMGVEAGLEHRVGVRPGRPLSGVVVDGDGKPVAGAAIRAMSFGFAGSTTTGDDGRFELLAPRGDIRLWVEGDGLASDEVQVAVTEGPPPPPVEVVARPDPPLRGWVIEGVSEQRVAGAVVLSERDPTNWTRTDENGEFELRLGKHDRVAAFADGLAWRSVRPPTEGQVEIRLAAGRAAAGRVVDDDGRPVAGARIYCASPRIEGGLDRLVGPVTGADGSFDCTWFPRPPDGVTGKLAWIAVKPGMGVSAAQGYDAAAAHRLEGLVLTLGGERTVRGALTTAGGEGIGDGIVEASWEFPNLSQPQQMALRIPGNAATTLAPDGSFSLANIPRQVEADLTASTTVFRFTKRLDPTARGEEVHDFVLPPGKPLSGVIELSGGGPLPSGSLARVEFLGESPGGYRLQRDLGVGPDGKFVFEDLPEGRYQIVGSVPGYEPGGAVAEAGESDVVLRPVRLARMTFRLVFPEGASAAEQQRPFQLALGKIATVSVSPRVVDVPAADGPRVVGVGQIRPGTYQVRVRGGLWRGEIAELEIEDGDTREIEIRLERSLGVPARLLLPDGSGLGGIRVVVVPRPTREGASPQTAISEADGSLLLSGLTPGPWVVHVAAPGYPVLDVPISVPRESDAELELRLAAAGGLRVVAPKHRGAVVEIRSPEGEPVYGLSGTAVARTFRFRVGDDGVLVASGVRAGPVDLVFSDPEGTPMRKRVEVPANDVVEVEVGAE